MDYQEGGGNCHTGTASPTCRAGACCGMQIVSRSHAFGSRPPRVQQHGSQSISIGEPSRSAATGAKLPIVAPDAVRSGRHAHVLRAPSPCTKGTRDMATVSTSIPFDVAEVGD